MTAAPPSPVPATNAEAPATAATTTDAKPVRRLVVLCADWCGTCRGYRDVMETVAARFPNWQATWIDIEDQSDLVDDLDVETFPTVLLYQQAPPGAPAEQDGVFFFGPMLPHEGTLQRQVELAEERGGGLAPLPGELKTLGAWLRLG
ncbi:MAG: hypothetical protein GAK30_03566 [Paracidovorax wautersii]|uniref:Thioredoxin domain-containing protein n=1 Tax=Paracidovorax wautersii TaxID=1177982 RepID=A0A7V8FKS4_9BURK|nr:MAG: hypothetical protein GAK30_03566 [Paracidovorax wautersii]